MNAKERAALQKASQVVRVFSSSMHYHHLERYGYVKNTGLRCRNSETAYKRREINFVSTYAITDAGRAALRGES